MQRKPSRSDTLSKAVLILIAAAGCAASQIRLSPGIVAGTPLTDTLISSASSASSGTDSSFNSFHSATKRLLIGPALRLDLPRGLGLEFDAIYQRINEDFSSGSTSAGVFASQTFGQTTANRWQFPLLVQYSHTMRKVSPFVEAGPAISTIAGANNRTATTSVSPPSPATTSTYTSTSSAVTIAGVTGGGGIAIPVLGHQLRAELRFSHWFATTAIGIPTALERTGDFSAVLVANPVLLPAFGSSPIGSPEHANETSLLLGFSF